MIHNTSKQRLIISIKKRLQLGKRINETTIKFTYRTFAFWTVYYLPSLLGVRAAPRTPTATGTPTFSVIHRFSLEDGNFDWIVPNTNSIVPVLYTKRLQLCQRGSSVSEPFWCFSVADSARHVIVKYADTLSF